MVLYPTEASSIPASYCCTHYDISQRRLACAESRRTGRRRLRGHGWELERERENAGGALGGKHIHSEKGPHRTIIHFLGMGKCPCPRFGFRVDVVARLNFAKGGLSQEESDDGGRIRKDLHSGTVKGDLNCRRTCHWLNKTGESRSSCLVGVQATEFKPTLTDGSDR